MAEHWCQIHKTKFFKTANMKSYAHPVKDEKGVLISWCNEDAQEVAKLEPQQPITPPTQPGEPLKPKTVSEDIKDNMKWKSDQIEINMWWKELGEMIRAKDIDMTKPAGKLMRTAYYAQMMSVLNLKIANKEP